MSWRSIRLTGSELRSALLGYPAAAICGAIVALVVSTWQASQETEVFVIGARAGISYPSVMFDNTREDGYQITFKPENFQLVAVCEYATGRGRNWGELAHSYLQKYPQCFVVRTLGEKVIEIRPNELSNHWSGLQYDEKSGTYWCKCPPEVRNADK